MISLLTAFALVACGEGDVAGEWRDSAGRTLASYPGPEHCDWESVTFLEVAFSLTRPEDAVATGFRSGDAELWVSPADADGDTYGAVYVVDDDVERWPRTREEIACA